MLFRSALLPLALAAAFASSAAAQEGRVYELHEAETLPRALNTRALTDALARNYPRTPRDSAFDGTVVVSLVVAADGVPGAITVVEPADPAFDSATVASVPVLRFRPGTVAGRAVPVRVTIPITWQFRDEPPPAVPDAAAAEALPELLNGHQFARALEMHYPELFRDAGIEGEVTVHLVVGVDGRPDQIRIAESSHRAFDAPTVRAVRVLRFRPARVNGEPMAVPIVLPVVWSVTPEPSPPFLSPRVLPGRGAAP